MSGAEATMRMFQVNQTNIDETRTGVLCAPDKVNPAGHQLVRSLTAGDVLFHYNSRLGTTHTASVVQPVSTSDRRLDRWRHRIDRVVSTHGYYFVYQGRHLTLDDETSPPGRFLVAFSGQARAVTLDNAFPRQLIYLREITEPTKQRLDVAARLGRT